MSIHLNAEFVFLIFNNTCVANKEKSIACIPKKTRTGPQKTPEKKTPAINLKFKSDANRHNFKSKHYHLDQLFLISTFF